MKDKARSEPRPPRPRRRKRWIVLSIIVLLLAGGGARWFWPRPLIISYETTRLTEPLYPDGTVNYLAALDAEWSAGVTPENNAAVLLVQAFGPDSISVEIRQETIRGLGVNQRDLGGPYFVKWDDYHRNAVTTRPELADEQPTWSPSAGPPAGPPDPDGSDSAATMPEADIAPPRPTARQMFETAQQKPWARADMPLLAEWLDVNREPLELIRAASRRTHYYVPLIQPAQRPHLSNVNLPLLGDTLHVPRVLTVAAMRSAGEGDTDAAMADLVAALRLAELLRKPPLVICGMVSMIAQSLGDMAIQHLVTTQMLSAKQCRRLIADMPVPVYDLARFIGSERYGLLDMMLTSSKDLFSLPIMGDTASERALDAMRAARPVNWNDLLLAANDHYDRMMAAMRGPTHAQRLADSEAAVQRLESISLLNRWWRAGFILETGKICEAHADAVMSHRLTLIALALAGRRAERGQYPADLAELVPDWLDAIPDDIFVDRPPIYRRTDDGFLLYSVGRNMADDGGLGRYDWPKDGPRHDWTADDIVVRAPARPISPQ